MSVKLYVEGGGAAKDLKIACTRGFRLLMERAGFKRCMPSIVACGGRGASFDRFKTALGGGDDKYPMLLVDSESAVSKPPWEHLSGRDGWSRPAGAADDQAQLMVQCMETWCVADRDALLDFFGQCLRQNALPALHGLEKRSKDDVQKMLSHATRDCGHGKNYQKGKRSFELLAKLNPEVLKERLPHFKRLCVCLSERLSPSGE